MPQRSSHDLDPPVGALPSVAELRVPADNTVRYYRRDRAAFGFLSHFWPAQFVLDGETWPTAEHFYQAQKSFDLAYRDAIRAARSPGKVKRLAANPLTPRRVSHSSWFRKNGAVPREDWDEAKLDIMRRADTAKFSQNADLALLLLATGDAELIEDSTSDAFWGVGRDGAGLNWAGRVLMEVRAALRAGSMDGGAIAD